MYTSKPKRLCTTMPPRITWRKSAAQYAGKMRSTRRVQKSARPIGCVPENCAETYGRKSRKPDSPKKIGTPMSMRPTYAPQP